MEENIKIYAGKHSEEIQKKMFELGYKWIGSETYKGEVINLSKPFLFFQSSMKYIQYSDDLEYFNNSNFKEVDIEYIRGLKKEVDFYGDLMPVSGFYVDQGGVFIEVNDHSQHYASELWNVYPTRELAEANKVLATLIQWRDRYNKEWTPNYNDKRNVIINIRGNLELSVFKNTNAVFSFKDRETAEKFYNDFKEQLEIVKPLI